jgi:cold shock protein
MQIKNGHVKWFDPGKGFGFAICDNGAIEVLLHLDALKQGGFEQIKPGATIECLAAKTEKGWSASRILSIDLSTAKEIGGHPTVAEPETDWIKAQVKWFNRAAGYGFLDCRPPWGDAYFHKSDMRRCGIVAISPGQTMMARLRRGERGMVVADMRPVEPKA